MEQLFAPPGAAWTPVSPSLARMRRTLLLAGACLLLLAALVTARLVGWTWLAVAAVPAVVVAAAAGWVLVGRNVRRWGYAERDEELYIKHGALFRRLVVVPYGRMQYVDVHAGPVEQIFGLAGVHLHTASPGTSARIPGLRAEEAARLRDRLTTLGEAQAAGL